MIVVINDDQPEMSQPLVVGAAPARRTAIGWHRECLAHGLGVHGHRDTRALWPNGLVSDLRSTEADRDVGLGL